MAPDGERVVWSPKARQDLHDIWQYFARVASPDIADKLARDIATVAQRVARRPRIGRPREDIMPGLRSARVHPYSVFYRMTDAGVEIARVLHERRNIASSAFDKG